MTETLIEPRIERRREARLRCLLTGTIVFDDNKATFDCVVRSISAHGARVELAEAFRVPETFDLVVPHHEQMHHAEVIWRKGERAGVALSDIAGRAFDRKRMALREQRRTRMKELAGGY
jgi:hypothetical protein